MELKEYLEYFTSLQPTEKSDLWHQLTTAIREELGLSGKNSASPETLTCALASLQDELHYGFHYAHDASVLPSIFTHLRSEERRLKTLVKSSRLEDKRQLANIASLIFLDSVGMLEEYLALMNTWAIVPDMASARHFYYAQQLRDIMSQQKMPKARVLEIGAGGGNMAKLLHHYGLVHDYTIVDLPEMLLMSGIELSQRCGVNCNFVEYPPNAPDEKKQRAYLIPANAPFHPIDDHVFDLALNFNSFSEMLPKTVESYLSLIYRTVRKGRIFMNVNRIQKHLQTNGAVLDMNPLLFPYASSDQVLLLDADPFQQFVRQFLILKPVKSTAIIRVARL